ncbi:hypothetical protein NMD1_01311 [Novosphingobium sp. MD-1]|nr:hypothetical protein NMD1_01311 [Novosphingobium sp. MD-1]
MALKFLLGKLWHRVRKISLGRQTSAVRIDHYQRAAANQSELLNGQCSEAVIGGGRWCMCAE